MSWKLTNRQWTMNKQMYYLIINLYHVNMCILMCLKDELCINMLISSSCSVEMLRKHWFVLIQWLNVGVTWLVNALYLHIHKTDTFSECI